MVGSMTVVFVRISAGRLVDVIIGKTTLVLALVVGKSLVGVPVELQAAPMMITTRHRNPRLLRITACLGTGRLD